MVPRAGAAHTTAPRSISTGALRTSSWLPGRLAYEVDVTPVRARHRRAAARAGHRLVEHRVPVVRLEAAVHGGVEAELAVHPALVAVDLAGADDREVVPRRGTGLPVV